MKVADVKTDVEVKAQRMQARQDAQSVVPNEPLRGATLHDLWTQRRAEIFGGEVTHFVRAGERGTFVGLEQLHAQIDPLGARTAFESWANDRERRETESQSAKYVSRES